MRPVSRAVVAVLGAAVLVGGGPCRRHLGAVAGSATTDVYRALLDSVLPGPRPILVVRDSSEQFDVPKGQLVATWVAELGRIPPALIPRLVEATRTAVASDHLGLPGKVVVMTRSAAGAVFRSNPETDWRNFHTRYPGAAGYFAFTPVVFSADGADALLYYTFHCGARCGAGNAAWLSRGSDGVWRVRQLLRFWAS